MSCTVTQNFKINQKNMNWYVENKLKALTSLNSRINSVAHLITSLKEFLLFYILYNGPLNINHYISPNLTFLVILHSKYNRLSQWLII